MMKKILAVVIAILVLVCLVEYGIVTERENTIKHKKIQIDYLNSTITLLEKKIRKIREKKNKVLNEKVKLEYEIKDLQRKNIILKSEYQQTTLKDVRKLLREDKTNKNEYVVGEYVCSEFAYDVLRKALRRGMMACSTDIDFKDAEKNYKVFAHMIVAFNTTEGIIYAEPQDDGIIRELIVGEDYCHKAGWDCDYIITHISNCFENRFEE